LLLVDLVLFDLFSITFQLIDLLIYKLIEVLTNGLIPVSQSSVSNHQSPIFLPLTLATPQTILPSHSHTYAMVGVANRPDAKAVKGKPVT
jgi:hypothetical protein